MTIYAVIPRPAWNNGIWSEVIQDYDTARRSVDGTKVVVKWNADDPVPSRLPEGALLYHHDGDVDWDHPMIGQLVLTESILDVMDGPEWTATPG